MHYRKSLCLAITGLLVLLTLACALIPPKGTDGAQDQGSEVAVEPALPIRDERLGEVYESMEGGFSFQQVIGYELVEFFGVVSMTPPDADQISGPMISLIGSLNEETKDAEHLLEELETELPAGFELSNSKKIEVDGIEGLSVEFSGTNEGAEVEGKAIIIAVTETHMFNLAAIFPAGEFGSDEESLVEAILETVRFFEPQINSEDLREEVEEYVEAVDQQEIRQWASSAAASSEHLSGMLYPEYAATQAAGAPDTMECVDFPTAWAPADSRTYEWIELEYARPVYPTEINIYQTLNPNQIVQVELRDLSGNYHISYLEAPQPQTCPYVLTIPVEEIDFLVEAVLVNLDQSVLDQGLSEIDAVELVGYLDDTAGGYRVHGPSGKEIAEDISTWSWSNYTTADGLPDDNILALAAADDGTIWIGMEEGGVASFQDGSFTRYTTADGLAYDMVTALAIESDGTIWAGTDAGLSRFNGDTWKSYTTENGMVCDMIYGLGFDHEENLWIGTGAGISMYDGVDFTNYPPLLERPGRSNALDVAVAANGDIWFPTPNGAALFTGRQWYYYTEPDGLSFDSYLSAGAAPDGAVWLGSNGEAVDRFDGITFTSFKNKMGPMVYVKAIAAGLDGSMWFGTEGSGIYRYDGQIWQQFLTDTSGLTSNRIDAIAVSPDGALWFATWGNGLTRFGP